MITKEALQYYDNTQKEIKNKQHEGLSKFIYYKIAVCAAAIAFSVNICIKLKLEYPQIPIGIAVLCWALSIFFGFKFLETSSSMLELNSAFFDVLTGRHSEVGNIPEKIEINAKAIEKLIYKKAYQTGTFSIIQTRLIYIGGIFFIIWAIIQMWLNSQT
ncbi:MAG: hypothetical protein QM791_05540 [Ferruginibacter sp.]